MGVLYIKANGKVEAVNKGSVTDLTGYATEEYVRNKIAEAELGGEEVDLSGYAQKSELPTKVSQLENDKGYLTAVPAGYAKTEDIPTKPSDIGAQPAGNYLTAVPDGYAKTEDIPTTPADIGAQPAGNYALKSEIPSVPVKSVNGKTGAVSLSASDVGAMPSGTKIPSKTSDLTNDSGYITSYTESDPTVPAWAKASTKPSYSKSEVGLGNVDNVKQYSASNPPPYPVTSVNGKTGAVSLDAAAVGARPSTWTPSASDVGALPASTTIPTKVSQLTNDKGYLTQHQDISGKVDKDKLALGRDENGLLYLYIDGVPVGSGVELPSGGIDGYITADKQIVFNNLPDGDYTLAYINDDGSVVPIGAMEKDTNVYYTVTNTLTQCTNSNSATKVVQGSAYSATITAKSGYELKSVTATMGGTAVSVSNGKINIASVTGNIVITAVAEKKQAAEPVTVDIALRDGIRLGSDGGDRTGASGHCATERINLTNIPKPCTIHLTKARWAYDSTSETGWVMTCAKNASGTNLVCAYTNTSIGSGYFTISANGTPKTDVTVTVTSADVAEICFSGQWADLKYSDSDVSFAAANTKATLTYTPAS